MKIQPSVPASAPPSPVSAPALPESGPSVEAADAVALTGSAAMASVSALPTSVAAAHGAASARAAAFGGLFGPPAGALAPVMERVQRLEGKGFAFHRRGKLLFWHTSWKASDAEHTARAALKGKPERLGVKGNGLDFQVLSDVKDLEALDAFYGTDTPGALKEPALAQALAGLEKAGLVLLRKDREEYHPSKVGAFGAYEVLTGQAGEGFERLSFQVGDKEYRLETAEDALLAAHLYAGGSRQGLARPEQAEVLGTLERGGFGLSTGTAYETYHLLGSATPPPAVEILVDGVVVDRVTSQEMPKTVEVLTRVNTRKADFLRLDASLGRKVSTVAWELLGQDGSARRFDERAELFESLHQAGAGDASALYRTVLERAADGEPLRGAAGDLFQVMRILGPDRTEAVQKAFGHVRADLPGTAGRAEEKLRYAGLLAEMRDPDLALRAQKALSQGPEAGFSRREEVFTALLQGSPSGAATAVSVLEALARAGRVVEDRETALALVAPSGATPEEASRGYEVLAGLGSPARRDAWKALYAACPATSKLGEAWTEVTARGEGQTPARAAAWARLAEAAGENEAPEAEATRALAALGDDVERKVQDFARVLRGDRGVFDQALKSWNIIQSDADPETLLRMFEATGDLDSASVARTNLKRADLPGADRPLDERREALARLIAHHGGRVERALEDYRHVAATGPSGRSLAEAADLLARFSRATGSGREARLAVAALAGAPPKPGSPSAAVTLEAALKVTGALSRARPLWESLESVASQEGALELLDRVVGLTTPVGSRPSPEAVVGTLRRLAEAPLDAAGQARLEKLAKRLNQPAWTPDQGWSLKDDPGRGLVWSIEPGKRTDASVTSQLFSLEAMSGSALKFDYDASGVGYYDALVVQASRPGGEWADLVRLKGGQGWTSQAVDLAAYDGGPVRVRFQFYSDAGSGKASVGGVRVEAPLLKEARSLQDLVPEGTWAQVQDPDRGTVWTDSPSGDYPGNADMSLRSGPIDLRGVTRPRLTFEAKHNLESRYDYVHVEVSEDGGDWKRLKSMTGQADWSRVVVDLSDYQDKTVRLAFRLTSDSAGSADGFHLAGASLVGGDAAGPIARLDFRTEVAGDERVQLHQVVGAVVDPALEAAQRTVALEHFEALEGQVGLDKALASWPLLAPRVTDPDIADHRRGVAVLAGALEPKDVKARYQQVLEHRGPGESVESLAQILSRESLQEFLASRDHLAAAAVDPDPEAEATRFYGALRVAGDTATARRAYDVATVPVGRETVAERHGQFLRLLAAHGQKLAEATESWEALTSWMAPGETLEGCVGALGRLVKGLKGDGAAARRAVRFVRERQLLGSLAKLSLPDCVDRLVATSVLEPGKLDDALQDLLVQERGPGSIEQADEQVVIGDIALPRRS